jgi:protein tyrosine/serine phosphatase
MPRLAPGKRIAAYCNMLFVDHGIFRLPYLNRHRLGEKAWRSAQPAPHNIRALAARGVRTILNLRGERQCGSYRLEREACHQYGITLVNFHLRSRKAPTRQNIAAALQLFEHIEYPMLMHCKSGADRTGMMSVLYLFAREGVPMAEASRQLSPLYGYFRWTRAGILETFFARYLEEDARTPVPFLEWVETRYDPEQLMRSFQESRTLGALGAFRGPAEQ